MNTTVKVAGFLLALVAVFGSAWGAGRAVGPVEEPARASKHGHGAGETAGDKPAADEAGPVEAAPVEIPGGLMAAQDGYRFQLETQRLEPGQDIPVEFTIEGPDGRPVTTYDVEHEKRLHLIAVRRDFTGYQHIHPHLGRNGTWTAALDLTPGQWRLFADFKATGAAPLTLGTDVAVPGDYQPATPVDISRTAVVDDYTVTITGELTAGTDSMLTLSVTRNGRPVSDLQPYLGAYGHLVALREGDLAYLHVHPDGTPGDGRTEAGPDVAFHTAVPSDGTYHLYLDFKHEGTVRTAAFALDTTGEPGETGRTGGAAHAHDGH